MSNLIDLDLQIGLVIKVVQGRFNIYYVRFINNIRFNNKRRKFIILTFNEKSRIVDHNHFTGMDDYELRIISRIAIF